MKAWGTARVVEGDAGLQQSLSDPDYPGNVERVILFRVEACDINCPPHIHPRFSQRQLKPVIEQLQTRIAELESEVDRLKSISSTNNQP